MKKFTLAISQGAEHLGSWEVGSEPLTLRIIDEDQVRMELTLRAPEAIKGDYIYEKGADDDFTMPIPVSEMSKSMPTPSAIQSLNDFIADDVMVEEVPEQDELSFELSRSLEFGSDDFSKIDPDPEPILDMADFSDVEFKDESIEFVANKQLVISQLRESIKVNPPPDIPAPPTFTSVEIAVWKQVQDEWKCIDRLGAGEDYGFHEVSIWVDNKAALLLTGSSNVYILVQKENGEEDEYSSLNGALQLPPMATIMLQLGDDVLYFRPE